MTARAARPGPGCATCALPVAVRAEVSRRAKQGDSNNAISQFLINEGFGIGREGVAGHLRHSGLSAEQRPTIAEGVTRSVLVAAIVGSSIRWHPGKVVEIATLLAEAGLATEAAAVQSHIPEHMRRALQLTEDSPAAELLSARALAKAVGTVVGLRHPAVAEELAEALVMAGADDLSRSLLAVARPAQVRPAQDRSQRVAQLRDALQQVASADRHAAISSYQKVNGPVDVSEFAEAMAARSAASR